MLRMILVPLDGSLLAEAALPTAVAIAHLTGARILLMQAVEILDARNEPAPPPVEDNSAGWPTPDANLIAARRGAADDYLTAIATRLSQTGARVQTRVATGPAATAIIEAARDADLVVMATHGRSGISRWALGSVADKVVQAAPTPVLLARAEQAQPLASGYPRHILVPLDGSVLAEQALPLAALLASQAGAELILTHIIAPQPSEPASGGDDDLAALVSEGARAYLHTVGQRVLQPGVTLHTDIHCGPATEGILAAAEARRADLIVMTTHGRSGLGRWLYGSVADRVLRGASVPVLLMRVDSRQPEPAAAQTPVGALG